jgi:outer membrane protein
MKKLRFAIILLLGAGSAAAQQPQAPPKGRIAVINTALLQERVAEFKAKIDSLNQQFEPRNKDLQSLADRINALETTIKSQSQVLSPARISEMTDQLEQMKREYRRKAEDLQADAERASNQIMNPIREKLRNFLQFYAARRGINIIIDLANAFEANTLLWFDPRIDITEDFISEYNKANPVQTAPKP